MGKRIGSCLGFLLIGAAILAVSGCGRRVRPIEIASDAGSQAVAKYDVNKNGVLEYKELDKAPGLQAGVATIKKLAKPRHFPSESELLAATITAEEIDARIREWKARGVGRIRVLCRVLRVRGGGRSERVANAEVKFVPEDFLGPGLPTGTGTTDKSGTALISQPEQGEGDKALGMSPGFYRVQIAKGTEIPAKYNTETILGQEVAADAFGIASTLVFELEY